MKSHSKVIIMVLLVCIACSHDEDILTPYNEVGLFTLRSISTPNVSSLQTIYRDIQGINYYLYGTRDSEGFIDKVTAMTVTKNENDSTFNILFNETQELKGCFFTVKGVPTDSFLSFRQMADSLIVANYNINWTTGERGLRGRYHLFLNSIKKYQFAFAETVRTKSDEKEDLALLARMVDVTMNAVIIGGMTAIGYLLVSSAPIVGAVLGFYAGFSLIIPNTALADEVYSVPLGSPDDPSSLFNKLKTPADLLQLNTWRTFDILYDGISGKGKGGSDCDFDDLLNFNQNFTVNWNAGEIECKGDTKREALYDYSISEDFQTLKIFYSENDEIEYTINSIRLNVLIINERTNIENWTTRMVIFKPE